MLGSWLFLMLSLVNMDIFLRFEADIVYVFMVGI